MSGLTIGRVADLSGVPAKTIRYYEDMGLMPRPARSDNGYRSYSEETVNILRFVARARGLGFPIKDVARLLELWRDRGRASADVKDVAREHLQTIGDKITALEQMRDTLLDLVERCHGDDRPACPILGGLAHTHEGETT
ncbi:MAG: MerR family copper efflux transcriptional regulator [Myxococcota bacterium]|jgi:MerR family copper efflux transcriptional regulator